jgi:D-xylose 1-dehydrogenase (NADP+, D-xylono-1,5-lactone-forming)
LRLGLLSTAKINGAILRGAAATDHVEVVAVASRDEARAVAYAAEHGVERAYGSYEELLADPNLDAVYISLPNSLHHEWTMRSLAGGKHVLCEKPYSRRPAEVEEAFDAAEAARLVLTEAFMWRHNPQTARVRQLVEEGRIGRLRSISASFSFFLTDQTNVRAIPELDGGALMDVGCYCVSGSRLLAGEPERVLGEQTLTATGVDAAFHGVLRFPDEVVAQIDGSFVAPDRQRLEVVGEDGVLTLGSPWKPEEGSGPGIDLRGPDGEERIEVALSDSYQLELEDFAAAVAGEREPLLGRADALGQARTIDALYRSAESGRAVTF